MLTFLSYTKFLLRCFNNKKIVTLVCITKKERCVVFVCCRGAKLLELLSAVPVRKENSRRVLAGNSCKGKKFLLSK